MFIENQKYVVAASRQARSRGATLDGKRHTGAVHPPRPGIEKAAGDDFSQLAASSP
jgi:hypothetical protein